MRVSKYLLSFSLFVGALPLLAFAQSAAQSATEASDAPTPVIKVKSNLVILDVVATDKNDRVVRDLKKEDFTVFENGVKQTIGTFESPAVQPPVPAAPMLDRNGHPNWGESPITIIVLDQLNTPLEEIAFAREQLFKYLQAQQAQLAEPTSLIVLNDRGIQDATPATRDRDALLATARHEQVGLPFRLNRGAVNEMLSESFALLRQIALSTRGNRGRKNVIWVGRGFPTLDPTGLNPQDEAIFLNAVRDTVNMMLDARVTLSKIDPRTNLVGVLNDPQGGAGMTSPGLVDDPFATSFSFNAFISQTGGRNFMFMNDVAREIQDGVSQGSNYYTLSYVPTDPAEDGKYRKVTILVNRPGVTVRAKSGFYAGTPKDQPSLQPSDRELGWDMLQAAVSVMEYNGVGLRLGDRSWDDKTGKLEVKVRIDTDSLSFDPAANGAERATFFVSVAALDEKGKVLSFKTVSPTVEIPADQVAQISTGHTTVPAILTVPQRAKSVRVIVRDSSGRIGTADFDAAYIAGLTWHLAPPAPNAKHGRG